MTDAAVRARDETKLCSYFSSFESLLDQLNPRFDGASISLPLLKIPIPVVVRCSMVIDKPECVTMVDDVSDAQQTPSLSGGWANRVKILLFVASVFLTLSPTSHAAPPGGGFHGGSFRSGFGAHSAGPAFRMGSGIRRNFAFHHGFAFHQNRRFSHRDHRFFSQQFAWPFYSYPYYPYDYSDLDYGPDNDYQYWDNSAASVQPESRRSTVDHNPVVVIINTGNSQPLDSGANTAYINSGYNSTDAAGQQRIVMQDPNEKIGPGADPTFVPPAVPQPTQTAAKGTQTKPQAQAGIFGNLVLVSWLEEAGKDVIYVQNTETNDVQEITSEPNLDNFRIVELHPNADLRLFEAVISNGRQQGPVRFRF